MGWKNFWIAKYDVSAFFAQKITNKKFVKIDPLENWKKLKTKIWIKKLNFFKFLLPSKKHLNFFEFSSESIFASFEYSDLFTWFFSKESWVSYFTIQKFLTALTSFLPPFYNIKSWTYMCSEHEIWANFKVKKGGKKLVRGFKTFDFFELDLSFCLHKKIIGKSLKLANVN